MEYEYYIVSLMDEKGMKQSDLARAAGISTSAVSRYVAGDTDIPASKLVKIAEALDVTVDDLLQTNQPTSEEHELISKYRRLSESNKRLVMQLIDSLK